MARPLTQYLSGNDVGWLYHGRRGALPPRHGVTRADAFTLRSRFAGGVVDGDSAASLFENLVDLFEQSAADGAPIREVVGEDPLEFVEAFIRNYPEGDWRSRERQRLIGAIDVAAGDRS